MRKIFLFSLAIIFLVSIISASLGSKETQETQQAYERNQDSIVAFFSNVPTNRSEQDRLIILKERLFGQGINDMNKRIQERKEQLPFALRLWLEGEQISIVFEDGSALSFTVDNGTIQDLHSGADNPTLLVHIDDRVLLNLASGSFNMDKAVREKQIQFEGLGLWKKVKFLPLRPIIRLAW